MPDALLHLWGMLHGIAGALACFALLHVCGLALTSRDRDRSMTLGRDGYPVVLAAAVLVLVCWFGIGRDIRLPALLSGFCAFAMLAVAVRFRRVWGELKELAADGWTVLRWVLVFAGLYALSYVFFMPSVTGEFLPLATIYNLDVHWYLAHTRYLFTLGPSNVAGFSFLGFPYLQTPAVFYLFGLFSTLFGAEPLQASMPMQFACSALLGVIVVRLLERVFGVSRRAALAVAAVVLSGPFFRYVAGNYYLSTMLATPVLMHLLWTTVSERAERHVPDPGLVTRFGAHYVLLLFLYPVLLFAGVALQAGVVALVGLASVQVNLGDRRIRAAALRRAARTIGAMLLAAGAIVLLLRARVLWSLEMSLILSQKDVAGWPLDLVSIVNLLGFPWLQATRITGPVGRVLGVALLLAVAGGLAALYFWRYRRGTTVEERAVAGLAATMFGAYAVYFVKLGPSYQQWKFASYFTLPWSFVVFAAAVRAWRGSAPEAGVASSSRGRHLPGLAGGAAAAALVAANLLMHGGLEPQLRQWPGSLRNMAAIDALPGFRELDVDFDNHGATMLAAYFIRQKTVHMASVSYYPGAYVAPERISRERPYLKGDFGCEGVGHDDTMTIDGVGCLLFAPPTVVFDTPFPFGRTYLPVTLKGLDRREDWGRWNRQGDVEVTFSADTGRMAVDRDAFLNLQLAPRLRPGLAGQRLVLAWGGDRRAETLLAERAWISLPVRREDWRGGSRLVGLTLRVTLPDAGPEAGAADGRPRAVQFEDASFTFVPRGRVVASAGAPPR
jgi:hypothetical protein